MPMAHNVGWLKLFGETFPTKTVYQVGKNVKGLSWPDTPQEISDECYQDALVIVTDTANQPRVDDDRYTKGKVFDQDRPSSK